MRHKVKVPKWGDTVTEVTVVQWLVTPGTRVEVGQSLAELETDKVDVELEAPVAGTICSLLAEEGQTLEVGEPIAEIDS